MLKAAFLESLPKATRWRLAAGAFAVAAAGVVGFQLLGRRLHDTGGPSYDDFQRAGSAAAQLRARADWGSSGLAAAREAWLLDLVFPVAYGALLALLASLMKTYADERDRDRLAVVTAAASWLALAAAAADLCVENAAVGVSLWATPSDAAAGMARFAGIVKWTLGLAVVLAELVALVALLARRRR